MSVDQVVAVFVAAYQHQSQQRRPLQVEATLAFARGQFVEGLGEPLVAAPVVLGEGQFEALVDHLERLLQVTLPEEAGAQDIVAVDGRLPGRAETRGIESADVDPELVQVVAASLLVE